MQLEVMATVQKWQETLLKHRRFLHQIPECSWQEKETSAYLKAVLGETSLRLFEVPDCYGFIAVLDTGKEGPCTCFRTDIDALPIHEESGEECTSRYEGRMHACGHDFHMSVLLTLALALEAEKEALKGKVVFLFQPAEEVGTGALRVLESGVLDAEGVEAVYGGHVWDLPTGEVICRNQEVMAASDIFHLTVRGQGGHGALPHMTHDPITAAASLIQAFQTLAARRHSPFHPLALSICKIQAGEAYNITPNTVEMDGTLRTFNPALREAFLKELEQCAEGIGRAHGVEIEFQNTPGPMALLNNKTLAEEARATLSASEQLRVAEGEVPAMVSEDFAYLADRYPSVFFLFGASAEGRTCLLHQSCSRPDEGALARMLETYWRIALKQHV